MLLDPLKSGSRENQPPRWSSDVMAARLQTTTRDSLPKRSHEHELDDCDITPDHGRNA